MWTHIWGKFSSSSWPNSESCANLLISQSDDIQTKGVQTQYRTPIICANILVIPYYLYIYCRCCFNCKYSLIFRNRNSVKLPSQSSPVCMRENIIILLNACYSFCNIYDCNFLLGIWRSLQQLQNAPFSHIHSGEFSLSKLRSIIHFKYILLKTKRAFRDLWSIWVVEPPLLRHNDLVCTSHSRINQLGGWFNIGHLFLLSQPGIICNWYTSVYSWYWSSTFLRIFRGRKLQTP